MPTSMTAPSFTPNSTTLPRRRGLTAAEHASAAACAAAIARRMQSNWENRVAQLDSAQKAIDAAATAGAASHEPADAFTRTQIHIAGGMVAIQLAVNADEAIDWLSHESTIPCRHPWPEVTDAGQRPGLRMWDADQIRSVRTVNSNVSVPPPTHTHRCRETAKQRIKG
jgi:hypothetical protein